MRDERVYTQGMAGDERSIAEVRCRPPCLETLRALLLQLDLRVLLRDRLRAVRATAELVSDTRSQAHRRHADDEAQGDHRRGEPAVERGGGVVGDGGVVLPPQLVVLRQGAGGGRLGKIGPAETPKM